MTDIDRIFAKLDAIEKSVMEMTKNGCAQSWQHRAHEDRLLKLENTQAEMRGKAVAAGSLVALIASAVFQWLGRRL